MDIFLALVAKISRDYAFSAFAVALLMILSYWIVTNEKVLKIVDGVLNKRLRESSLYKFIRLLIVLAFSFSVIVVLLSFVSPLVAKMTENRSLELLVSAREKFGGQHYAEARTLFKGYLNLNPDMAGADEIRGMITASYYGQGLHEEGLQFICDQYEKKARGDRSYHFNVHAHIRAISVAKGTLAAEMVARRFRKKCDREDYSEFWAHIPFGMMESLRIGRLRTEHGWSVTPESKARLLELLTEKRSQALSRIVPNSDFVLYFLDQFDELIKEIPKSSIRDLAFFDAARFAHDQLAVDYLKRLVDEYPHSVRYQDGIVALVALLAKLNRRDEALTYVARLNKTESMESAAYAALSPTLTALDDMISSGDYQAGFQITDSVCKKSESLGLSCYQLIAFERRKLIAAAKAANAADGKADCVTVHKSLRPLDRGLDKHLSTPWVSGMRTRLVNCLPNLMASAPEQYPKAIYLIASLSRRLNDYGTSMQYLQRFDQEIAESELKDDVVTEMGYQKLIIERDWPTAKALFERVLSTYPARNAYDNALWWYAKGLKEQGDYGGAIQAYAQIAATEAISRFKQWSSTEVQQLRNFSSIAPFAGVALRVQRDDDISGLFVVDIGPDSPVAAILHKGDRLLQACGKRTNAIDELLAVAGTLGEDTECKILFVRNAQLLVFSGSPGHNWKLTTMQLTPEDRQALAAGTVQF